MGLIALRNSILCTSTGPAAYVPKWVHMANRAVLNISDRFTTCYVEEPDVCTCVCRMSHCWCTLHCSDWAVRPQVPTQASFCTFGPLSAIGIKIEHSCHYLVDTGWTTSSADVVLLCLLATTVDRGCHYMFTCVCTACIFSKDCFVVVVQS